MEEIKFLTLSDYERCALIQLILNDHVSMGYASISDIRWMIEYVLENSVFQVLDLWNPKGKKTEPAVLINFTATHIEANASFFCREIREVEHKIRLKKEKNPHGRNE